MRNFKIIKTKDKVDYGKKAYMDENGIVRTRKSKKRT